MIKRLQAAVIPGGTAGVLRWTMAAWIGITALAAVARAQNQQQQLVPAVFNTVVDSQGYRWDISNYGQIGSGTNNSFNSAQLLAIDRSSFRPTSALMTPDGSEYVFTGQVNNLQITRRVKVDQATSAVRYVEVLSNTTSSPVTTTVMLRTQLVMGPAQIIISDQGTPVAGQLGPSDEGIVVVGQPQTGQLTLLFHLAGSDSKVKPTFQNQNNQQFVFSYTVTVDAGKTVSIVHGLAQRRLPSAPTGKAAAELFKPFRTRSWTSDLPVNIRRAIINLGPKGFASDRGALFTLDSLGIQRQSMDVLAIGEQTRLQGTATCRRLELATSYGTLEIELARVAAIAGPRFTGGLARVFLTDGQVYNGQIQIEGLNFVLNSGLQFDVDVLNLDRLVMRAGSAETGPEDGVAAMLETSTGDRLALMQSNDQQIAVTTPWGRRAIQLDEIERMYLGEQKVGHHFLLRDGSRLFAFIGEAMISLGTQYFGVQSFAPARIHRLTAAHLPVMADEEPSDRIAVPHLLLAGDNLLIGQVDVEALHFVTSGNKIPVPPNQIRVLRSVTDGVSVEEEGTVFEAALWDGGTVRGVVEELVLPVRSADLIAQVPLRDIVEVHVPTPVVTDTMRQRIMEWIEQLGDAQYEKRQAARKALAELGHLPKLQLDETLRQTSDPEVRRSVEGLLAELDE